MAMKPIEILINAKDNASGVFDRLNGKLKVVGAAIAGYFGIKAFAGIVEGAADFEQAMSRVQAATGASAQEMAQLNKSAQDAGATTKFTSTEAAGALENLGKAGLSAKDAVATLPAVLNLAQAGDVGLAAASEYLTGALAGMGLGFSEAGRAADVLALGANASKTNVDGLALALSYAAPAAQSAGVSLEGTVAILGKMADGSIDASRGGTALANMLAQFQDPTSQFKRALADAGITTNNFEKALHQLAAAGPKGEKAILAVGLNAGPALRALLNQGMGALDELKGKLEGSAGSAAAFAKVMQDNLAGSFKGLTSAWDTVKNVLGTPVLPVLKDGVDQLAAALRGAVADGTIGKFGEAIAAAFQAGIKWVKEFVGAIDFTKLAADLRAFADRTGEVFTQVGEYARNAGDIVKTSYGVMATGTNVVLTAIYGIGTAFAETAAFIVKSGIAINEQLQKIAFGEAKDRIIRETEQMRNVLQLLQDSSTEFGNRMRTALGDTEQSAQLARDGFSGLAGAMRGVSGEAGAAAGAQGKLTQELKAGAEAAAAAGVAYQKKAQVDQDVKQASDEHRVAIGKLRAEYEAFIAAGDAQKAAETFVALKAAIESASSAADTNTKKMAELAKQVSDAFVRMGVVSSAALNDQAANSLRDFNIIKDSGLATAQDLSKAFKKAADDAIAANNGIAPSWVTAQAAANKYTVEVDAAGKASLKAGDDAAKGTARAAEGWRGAAAATREATQAVAEYQQRVLQKYGKPGQGDKPEDLAPGVKKWGGTYANKDGMTSDAKGNVQQQWLWTRAAIIDYLESAGLDKTLAEDLAKQFVKSDGSVDYIAGSAQKKWGGKYSTLSEALGKMVDYYKYDSKGKAEAANRSAYLGGGKPPENPNPPPAPGPVPGRNSSFGNTYVSNITLPGQGVTTLNFADAASQRAGEELMRQLAAARGTSSVR